jgi:hypothetical protein
MWRKWFVTDFEVPSLHLFKGLKKNTNTPVRIFGILDEFRTDHPPFPSPN